LRKKFSCPGLIYEVITSLFQKPCTREYPFEEIEVPEGFRGKMSLDFGRCISCSLCNRNCPSGAIELVEVSEKKVPLFHFDTCIFCYLCVEVCPRDAILPSNTFEMATDRKGDLDVLPSPDSLGAADASGGK